MCSVAIDTEVQCVLSLPKRKSGHRVSEFRVIVWHTVGTWEELPGTQQCPSVFMFAMERSKFTFMIFLKGSRSQKRKSSICVALDPDCFRRKIDV